MSWTERRGRLGALARRLTEPAQEIPEGEERRHARVLSVVALSFSAVVIVIGWIPVVFYGVAAWRAGVWLGTSAGFVVALAVSRTMHKRLAAWLIVAVLAGSTSLALVGSEPEVAAVTLVFLVVPASIAAVVLPLRDALAFAGATLAGAAVAGETVLDIPARLAAPALVFLVLGTTLIFLVVEVRRRDRLLMYAAVRELAESREGWHRLFDASVAAMGISEAGVFTVANRALAELLGFDSPADVGGLGVLDVVAEESRAVVREAIDSQYEGVYEFVIVRRDGTRRHVESNARPFVHGGRSARIGVLRDVTAEREAQERLRMALEASRMRTWEWDLGDDTVVWTGGESPVRDADLGVPISWDAVFEALHPDDRPLLLKALEGSFATGSDYVVEYRLVSSDGSVEWVAESGRPIYGEAGEPVRVVGVSRVITKRKAAEEALRASEERYRELFENANDAVITLDGDWLITSGNRAAEALLGRDRSEILGRPATDFIAPEQHDLIREQERLKLSGEATATTYELDLLHAGGRRVPVDISTRLILEDGRPAGIHAIMRDASGRKALEEQLRQAQRLEAVGRLAGGVAHDFNNILTAIDGYNDMLLDSLDPDDARRFDALEVKRAAERAADLTRQLLAFSRRQVLQPRVIDLNELVPDLESLLRRTIGEDVSLETLYAESHALVKADRGQLEQVLMNLAVNARDAMPDGGRLTIQTGSVTLAGPLAETLELPAGAYVELTVRDTGVGMDDQTRAQVFEPFFTTKASGEGTGLGLATAYGIVRQSGGQIRVESEPGRGTAFHVLLPVAPAGEAPAPSRGERERPKSGSETMLLVEDEDMVRRLARLSLERRGYRVLEAAGADEALRLAAEFDEPIHLLLTDIVMPGMNGRALAERLAGDRPETRVLFMSGYPDDAIVRHGISEADVAFLEKPFSPDDLAEKVREVLDTA